MEEISWNDFEKVEMRVGTILEAEEFPEARKPAYKMKIDFGAELGTRVSSAQITKRYHLDELVGKQILAVVNFPAKRIAGFKSECLVMGVVGEDNDVVLATPDKKTKNGLRLL